MAQTAGGYLMKTASRPPDLRSQLNLVVDPDAEPFDLDQFLDALDRIVDRRLSQAKTKTGSKTLTPIALFRPVPAKTPA